jgi:hypothetical protein
MGVFNFCLFYLFPPYVAEETVAEVWERWKGPYYFGAPDNVVVNITIYTLWN